jgi:hypothetical protein
VSEINTDHYITVAKLRELLAGAPDDALVVMSKDSEGNGFSPFSEWGDGRYVAESSWSGYLADEGEDDDEPGEDDVVTADPDYEAPDEPGVPCIVLWPTN